MIEESVIAPKPTSEETIDSLLGDTVDSVLDAPPETTPPVSEWTPLYAGLDQTPTDPRQAGALDYLGRRLGPDKELRAQAINQSYVQSHMKDWEMNVLQQHWPTVRDTFAKEQGFTHGEPITDSALYTKIGASLAEEDEKQALLAKMDPFTRDPQEQLMLRTQKLPQVTFWQELNTGLIKLPELPANMPDVPIYGYMNPAIVAGVYNAAVKPFVEGATSPLGIATMGLGAEASGGSQVAKKALAGITGLFAVLLAHAAGEKAGEASVVLKDPNATTQQKTEAVAGTVSDTLLSLLTAFHTVGAVKSSVLPKLEGKTAPEAAQILRQEANATAEKPVQEALTHAADKLDDIPAPRNDLMGEGAPERGLETEAVAEKPALKATETPASEETAPAAKETGETAPPKAEPVTSAEVEKAYSIKNAAVEKELDALGLPEAERGPKRTRAEAAANAKAELAKDPEAGAKLVDELETSPRAPTPNEDALLNHELVRLSLERDKAQKAFDEAVKVQEPDAIAEATSRITEIRDQYRRTADVLAKVGTESSHSLSFRKMALKEDYSLANLERLRVEARGGEALSPEQLAEVKSFSERLAEKDQQIADIETKLKELEAEAVKERAQPKGKPPGKIATKLAEKAEAARARIKAFHEKPTRPLGKQGGAVINPAEVAALLKDYAIVGADYIAKGVTKFGDWSEAMVKEFGERILPHLKEIYEKASAEKQDTGRVESAKTRLATSIADYSRRIKEGDFSPKAKRPAVELDEAGRRAQAERDLLKQEYDTLLERDRYEKSSKIEKIKTQGLAAYDAARLLMTTGEFSFILRQGKMGVLSHPVMAARILPDTFRALVADPAGAHALNLKILNHPDAAAAKAAKLHLVEEGASLNKQEEFLMSKLVENQPVLVNTVGRFNRAATVFLNRLRFDMWQSLRKSSGGLDAAEQKQVAMFVNEATGRGGLGSLEAAAVPLGRIMFAPRYLASRLQIAAGHSLWGGTWATRRAIATEYARTLVGLGVYYSALYMALNQGDKQAEIGTDPRSSDFGKVKIGNTRLDPLAGVAQVATFAARTATGETVNSKGKEKDIRGENVPYGGDKWSDVAARFARSKLHPVPGAIINLFDGTDLGGHKADIANQALNLSGPLTYMDIYQALEEQDLPEGAALGLLAMFGEGLQTYDANQNHPKVTTSPR